MLRLKAALLVNVYLAASVCGSETSKRTKGSPPVFDDTANNLHQVANGTRLTIKCPVKVIPGEELLIDWFKDDKEIREDFDDRYKIAKDKHELRIKNVKFVDEGFYRCRVVNGFGHFDMVFQVQVYDPKTTNSNEYILKSERKRSGPKWLNETEIRTLTRLPIRLYDGENLILRCAAEGNPIPEIKWLRDGRVLQPLTENKKVRTAELMLKNVNSSISGEYTCVLSNQHGSLNATFQICAGRYRTAKSCKIETPEIDKNVYSVASGRTAHFVCKFKKISHDPSEPAIKWLRLIPKPSERRSPGEIVYENKTFLIIEQDSNSVERNDNEYINRLVIPNVRYDHEGFYVCAVQAGSSIMHTTTELRVISGSEQGSFSRLYFYLGIPVMIIILIFVAYAVYFLHKNRQTKKSSESLRFITDTMKPVNKSKYSLPPPPLMPPPQTPVNPYMPSQHPLCRKPPNPQYLTQEMICNQSMQQNCYPQMPSLNRSKRMPYQNGISQVTQPYAAESISPFYESTPKHFHSSQTLPASARIDSCDFDPEYLRGRRPCPTEVDGYGEQRQPFLSANAI